MKSICLPLLSLLVGMCLTTQEVSARINLVTLPGRDTVQLTIYNSADITMVKETRHLTFRKGLNRLEFSWANTLIDPTSVEFRAVTHADEVEVLDVRFPPRVTNTLEWHIQSEFSGEVQVEIRYFTSGLTWSAQYLSEVDQKEKVMNLVGSVRINNKSGEDYENAQVRLVVGVIRVVEDISHLAKNWRGIPQAQNQPVPSAAPASLARSRSLGASFAMALDESVAKPKEIIKEGLSEYFMYTVEGRDTIPNGWSKNLPSFKSRDVAITSYYKYEKERWGDQVIRFYRFKNDTASKLGNEPLPNGTVQAFRLANKSLDYAHVGRTEVKYIPINEQVDLELGADPEVLVEAKMMNWEKTDIRFDTDGNVKGWTIKEKWQFEVQNSKDIDIVVDIRRNYSGDWSMQTEAPYEKVDAQKVKFTRRLKPHEKVVFNYELTTRHGVNASK